VITPDGADRAWRPLPLGSLAFLAALAATAISLVAAPAGASVDPPPTGDWLIGPLEDAVLPEGNTTVVQGNITVQGSLFVGNATLELAPQPPGSVATLLVSPGARLRLEGATVAAGANSSFVVRLEPSGRMDAVRSTLDGLGALNTTQLSGVGLLLRGATAVFEGLALVDCVGGIGAQEGSLLTASNLTLAVHRRALYAAGGSSATLANLTATGNLSQSDYLVIVEGSTLVVVGGSLGTAPVAVLSLSATATFQDVDMGPLADVGMVALSSTISWRGGTVAPHARAAFESYGSTLDVETALFNASIGLVAIESTLRLSNSTFNASASNPTSSFAAVYARDSTVGIADSALSGEFWVRDDVVVVNGTPQIVPRFSCATSSVWSTRSQVTVERTSTRCFAFHFQMEDSDFRPHTVSMENGTEGIRMLRGSLTAVNITGTTFTGPSEVVVAVFEAEGSIDGIVSRGNTITVEVTGSNLRIDRMVFESPGTGVRVVSGSPTINGSSFRAHNATAVEVLAGSPVISNSTFDLSADTMNATGVFVVGGAPLVETSMFSGRPPRSLTFGVWSQAAASPTVRGSVFVELDRAAVVYGRGFLLEGNAVEACNQGFESREFSSGTIAYNTFSNMTTSGFGNAVRIYLASTLVASNQFEHVNYGVQVIFLSPAVAGETRISGNTFRDVRWYAIQVFNSTRPVVIDNNTVRAAAGGAVELFRAPAIGSYNLFIDSDGYGYSVIETNLTIVGDRLENLSRAVEAIDGNLQIRYATFSRNAIGVFAQDSPTSIQSSSFQSNALAVEFPNGARNEVHDSLFLSNGDSILAFNSAEVDIWNTNFVRTLGYIVSCEQNASANIVFTRRGEISGGTLRLRGDLVSDAATLRLTSIRFQFQPLPSGIPGVFIRGAGELSLAGLDFTNSSVRYQFVLTDSVGTVVDTTLVAPFPGPTGPARSPTVERSDLVVRNLRVEFPQGAPSFIGSTVVATNLTIRNSNASSLYLEGGSFSMRDGALLDGRGCGIRAAGGAELNATNVSIRGHPNGSVCGADLTASIFVSDLASGPADLDLAGESDVGLWSTQVANGWRLADNATVTRGWRVSVSVTLANPSLLPAVVVAVSDVLGHRNVSRPNGTGAVSDLPYFPQVVDRVGTSTPYAPYTVSATLGPFASTETISLDRDTLVQLSLDDTVAPTVSVLSPTDGWVFAEANITITFAASDTGTGIRDLTYRFGAGTPVTVAPQNASFQFVRSLVDGLHGLTVRAVDYAGNSAEASLNFTVDTLAPLISVNSPRIQPFLTSEPSVHVQVGFDADVVLVTIGGEEALIYRGTANRTVVVDEGENTVEVTAVDLAGNIARANITIVADRTPPALDVANRMDSNITVESFVVVRGTSEPGALVFVQGVPVVTAGGSFEALVRLSVGENSIDIRARDALGNENATTLSLSRGVLEPSPVLDIALSILGLALLAVGAYMLVRTVRAEYARAQPRGRRRGGRRGGP